MKEEVRQPRVEDYADVYLFAAEANEMLGQLRERNAALERAMLSMSANCKWREQRLCDLDCLGREFCDVDGLNAFYWGRAAAAE